MSTFSLAIHGGAGTILRQNMTTDQEKAYQEALQSALDIGEQLLQTGHSALDVVEATVKSLEDCPLFNAGRGSVFTHEGAHEMDAAIMCGATKAAGAVGLVQGLRNPIALCRKILDHSEHIFLCGKGAMAFAQQYDLPFESTAWFHSDFRWQQLLQAQNAGRVQLDHSDQKFGTVGAVALDTFGNIAAATSTGGMTNKRFGRIGDSPLIGAGTYADNQTCAISCTGHGEQFIQGMVAYDVACLMQYKGLSLQAACATVIFDKMEVDSGGLIAVDTKGNVALPFNSEGMYRGFVQKGQASVVQIYKTAHL